MLHMQHIIKCFLLYIIYDSQQVTYHLPVLQPKGDTYSIPIIIYHVTLRYFHWIFKWKFGKHTA
uniref:Uncharacterized protein n=1 Tax=Ciona intestinalis TaxID=7719 RepID=H2XNH0_CIOIN